MMENKCFTCVVCWRSLSDTMLYLDKPLEEDESRYGICEYCVQEILYKEYEKKLYELNKRVDRIEEIICTIEKRLLVDLERLEDEVRETH